MLYMYVYYKSEDYPVVFQYDSLVCSLMSVPVPLLLLPPDLTELSDLTLEPESDRFLLRRSPELFLRFRLFPPDPGVDIVEADVAAPHSPAAIDDSSDRMSSAVTSQSAASNISNEGSDLAPHLILLLDMPGTEAL